jgi:hypothetical protein
MSGPTSSITKLMINSIRKSIFLFVDGFHVEEYIIFRNHVGHTVIRTMSFPSSVKGGSWAHEASIIVSTQVKKIHIQLSYCKRERIKSYIRSDGVVLKVYTLNFCQPGIFVIPPRVEMSLRGEVDFGAHGIAHTFLLSNFIETIKEALFMMLLSTR